MVISSRILLNCGKAPPFIIGNKRQCDPRSHCSTVNDVLFDLLNSQRVFRPAALQTFSPRSRCLLRTFRVFKSIEIYCRRCMDGRNNAYSAQSEKPTARGIERLSSILMGSASTTAPMAAAMNPTMYSRGSLSIFGVTSTTKRAEIKNASDPSRLLARNRCLPNRLPNSADVVSEIMRMVIAVMAMTLGKINTQRNAERSTFEAPFNLFLLISVSCRRRSHPNHR